jgi:GNAT superfamily N-acetyltransferase
MTFVDHTARSTSLTIRPARSGEAGLVLGFICELAAYEKLSHEVDATEELLDAALFGENARVHCDVAEWEGKPVGFALWFYSFSTFRGRHGIYLEDLFVRPENRGRGIGKALLVELARRCTKEGLPRLEWWVLHWNTPSIDVYRRLGAVFMDDWTRCRLSGEALTRLADLGER